VVLPGFVGALPKQSGSGLHRRSLQVDNRRSSGVTKSNVPVLTTLDPDRYISCDYAAKEKRLLWPRVWQIACREEEIPTPGSYVTYEIADESIVVIRTRDNRVAAFHNVCPHRGRRLVQGCGNAGLFRCRYHGWTYNIDDGRNTHVQDRDDWAGGLDDERPDLRPVRVDSWGGFVFIDLRTEGETLAEYLEGAPASLGPFEYEKMRYRWYATLHLPCNWKVAVEAFIEGYHVAATHTQLLPIFGDDYTASYAQGKHSYFRYERMLTPLATPSPRLNREAPKDPRLSVIEFFDLYERDLKALFTERDCLASHGLLDAVPAGTDALTAFGTAVELGRMAAEADGVGYPKGATFEHVAKAGADWHVFPNFVTLPWFDGALCYRARPDGDDPNRCLFDAWSIARYAPGKEPPLQRRIIEDPSKESLSPILDQDIANMGEVQRGMRSSAFTRCLPNPVQEVPVINLHRTLDRFLGD
jgi:phenylpropionate dioxygenase-like ring-hydroxylating dioxygenase large terminal subunit